MDLYAVVQHGNDRALGLMTGIVELRRGKIDVIGLPLARRQRDIDVRRLLAVDRGGLARVLGQAEGIEYLDLVAAVLIDAAVAPALPAQGRHEGHAELNVQLVAAELPQGFVVALFTRIEPSGWQTQCLLAQLSRLVGLPSSKGRSTTAPAGGCCPSVELFRSTRFISALPAVADSRLRASLVTCPTSPGR